MEQIVVKTEAQQSGEILLFYVDGSAEEGDENQVLQLNDVSDFEILERSDDGDVNNGGLVYEISEPGSNEPQQYEWTDEEVMKLLTFYTDNKEAFLHSESFKHLWTVACSTILTSKTVQNCETKLLNLKQNYAEYLLEQKQGYCYEWNMFSHCHQAFKNDKLVEAFLNENNIQVVEERKLPLPSMVQESNTTGTIVVEQVNTTQSVDEKVEAMLKLYLRYKTNIEKSLTPRSLWETIAMELGEEGSDYWHKRFLNFKQHYLRMLVKRETDGAKSVNWCYMDLFDQIFGNDPVFQKKYVNNKGNFSHANLYKTPEWNDSECTVLAKYYFDCFDEFQDSTVPNNFLWNEVGRLLDKKPDDCKSYYEEMKRIHLDKYSTSAYTLVSRIPIEIIFDNIIAKEVEIYIRNPKHRADINKWSKEEVDQLVHYFYENVELFKDHVCHFVCWAYVSNLLNKDLMTCKKQWEELKVIYKSILNDKKENPETNIDWIYIDIFDRIFDFGMDTNLLNGYEKLKNYVVVNNDTGKIGVPVAINIDTNGSIQKKVANDDDSDDSINKEPFGDKRVFKILDYYLKRKDEFVSARNSKSMWSGLSKKIGLSNEQCAHRLRNLKLMYTNYVEREMNKPEVPILWPYYDRCKKVFGMRATRFKLIKDKNTSNNKKTSNEVKEWSSSHIKQLLNLVKNNVAKLTKDSDSLWSDISQMVGKSKQTVRDKFMELRKSYRRIKALKEKNPKYNLRWRYLNQFNKIYEGSNASLIDVDDDVEMNDSYDDTALVNSDDDEEYQCIIILPEGEETSELSDAQVIPESENTLYALDSNTGELSDAQVIQESENTLYALDSNTGELSDAQVIQESENTLNALDSNTGDMSDAQVIQESENTLNALDINTSELSDDQVIQENTLYALDSTETEPRLTKWNKMSKKKLLILYYNYIKARKGEEINPKQMWQEIASKLTSKRPHTCRKMFTKLKINHLKIKRDGENAKKRPFNRLMEKILTQKVTFTKKVQTELDYSEICEDVLLPSDKVELALQYYLQNIDDFTSPKFEQKYLWTELSNFVSLPKNKLFKKINYLKQNYCIETGTVAGEATLFSELLKEIVLKENATVSEFSEPMNIEEDVVTWTEEEVEKLLVWYLANLEKFKSPKFVRKYLWLEVSSALGKTPMACSRKMSEVRSQYKTLIKGSTEDLLSWRFNELCQKIYGTGKKIDSDVAQLLMDLTE